MRDKTVTLWCMPPMDQPLLRQHMHADRFILCIQLCLTLACVWLASLRLSWGMAAWMVVVVGLGIGWLQQAKAAAQALPAPSQQSEVAQVSDQTDLKSRLQTEVFAKLSHDMRTPMHSMSGALELLKQTELTERQRNYVQLAQHSSDQLLAILQQVSAVPCADSGNAQHPFSGKEAGSQGLSILLADDHQVNQMVTQSMLTRLGHSVVVADNGRQVLELLDHAHFDVLMLDVTMPQMDGLQVLSTLRKEQAHTGLHQRIVMLTGHAMPGDEERLLALGADAYVSKPVAMAALKHTLQALMAAKPTEVETKPLGI